MQLGSSVLVWHAVGPWVQPSEVGWGWRDQANTRGTMHIHVLTWGSYPESWLSYLHSVYNNHLLWPQMLNVFEMSASKSESLGSSTD